MRFIKKIPLVSGIAALLIVTVLINCTAEESNPVVIEFDRNSDRTDIMTGNTLPDYKYAQQGSFQFFLGRLDNPDRFIYYFHDGRRQVDVTDLASMNKDQARFAIWNLVWKNGRGLHPAYGPRIHHLAVSFIPLGTATMKPEKRVYLLLNELQKIEWQKSVED
ncbi:hypothetical protein ACFL6H_02385 [Candidatus Latescibacterota bacterium]